MDGKEYISSFTGETYLGTQSDGISPSEELRLSISASLARKLILLYGYENIHSLHGVPEPQAVNEVIEDMADENQYRGEMKIAGAKFNQRMHEAGRRRIPWQYDMSAMFREDSTACLTSSELETKVTGECSELQNDLIDFSNNMLCRTVLAVNHGRKGKPFTESETARTIKELIGNYRNDLWLAIEGFQGVITLERDFTLSRNNGLGQEVDLRVSAERKGTTPAWLPATIEWQTPIHKLCSAMTELETFLALKEWAVARNLPYLPILPPLEFECGRLNPRHQSGITRSDVLLCCMLTHRNEVVPFQVKNYVRKVDREQHHPGVILIGPRELGMESQSTCRVKHNGLSHTGIRQTVTYGRILEHYLNIRRPGVKGTLPSKREKAEFANVLAPAFEFFDRVVMEHIQNYTDANPKQSANA